MLAGLEDATSGDIFIGSERVNDVADSLQRHRDGLSKLRALPHMTIAETSLIAAGSKDREKPKSTGSKAVADMLEIAPLLPEDRASCRRRTTARRASHAPSYASLGSI